MPVMTATRALRRSCSACCPLTPAPLRATDTPRAPRAATTTPSEAASRTGTVSSSTPQAKAPAAIAANTPRRSQP